ncbi:MAG: hypothetical protein M1813_009654 [Trichoglossum hirsutum]|nr:MAG: hypothetical protein M1813_009654 [Trichoglossum hirsutum]
MKLTSTSMKFLFLYSMTGDDSNKAPSERTRLEIILKLLAIHLATIVAVARLGILRKQGPRSGRRYFDVIGFFLFPLLPIGQLVHRSVRSLKNRLRHGPYAGDISYHIAAAFGVEVPFENEHIMLLDVGYRRLQRISKRYDLYWAGSLVLLLVFITQAISTLVLFVRRTLRGQMAAVDEWAASIALGGLFSQLVSLGLSVMNFDWALVDVNMELASGEPANNRCLRCPVESFIIFLGSGEPTSERSSRYMVELYYTGLAFFTWSMLIQGTAFGIVVPLVETTFREALLHAREFWWGITLIAIVLDCIMAMTALGFVISICDTCSTRFLSRYGNSLARECWKSPVVIYIIIGTAFTTCYLLNQFLASFFDILHMKSSTFSLYREEPKPSLSWKDPLAEKLLIF